MSETRDFKVGLVGLYGRENNGLRYLVSVLRQHGFPVCVVFFKEWINNALHPPTEAEIQALTSLLKRESVGLVGLSFGSSYFKVAKQLTEAIRRDVGAPIAFGGMHATVMPEKCIDVADIVCVGEGEHPTLELAERMSAGEDYSDVRNLWVRRDGEVIKNEPRDLLADLDSLPFRDYSGVDTYYITGGKLVESDPIHDIRSFRINCSRGCLFRCSYCYNSVMTQLYKGKGKYYRLRSVGNVLDEIEYARSKFKRITRIIFDDDVFCIKKEWLDEFCPAYQERVGLPFECMVHPSIIDEERLTRLKEVGLRRVQIGIQGGTKREVEEVYDRALPHDKILAFGEINRKLGLEVVYDVILDDPLATEEDKRELVGLLLKLERPYNLFLYSLTVFPKTGLAKKLLEKGLITEKDIEGEATKTLEQFRVSMGYPRPKFDRFILALLVLVSKGFIPKRLILALAHSRFFQRHPVPLLAFAYVCNLVKMIYIAAKMFLRGDLTLFKLKQFANLRTLISQ